MTHKKDSQGFYRAIPVDKLPERKIVPFKIKGKKLVTFRLNQTFHVFQNLCPHKNKSFKNAYINKSCLVCNHHNWLFELDTGFARKHRKYQLTKFPCKISDNYLWIKISALNE